MKIIKDDRSLVLYILLNIVTLGIYGLYFVHKLAQDVNYMCSDDNDKTTGVLLFLLFSLLTCGIYSIHWMCKLQIRLRLYGQRNGLRIEETAATILTWYLIGFFLCSIGHYVAMHIIIKNMNAVAENFNEKEFKRRSDSFDGADGSPQQN